MTATRISLRLAAVACLCLVLAVPAPLPAGASLGPLGPAPHRLVELPSLPIPGSNCLAATSVIDSAGGYAYFGLLTMPGQVIKVRLSDFSVAATLTLDADELGVSAAAIDPANGYAYFGTYWSNPAKVVRVRLSDFTRVDALGVDLGSGWHPGILSALVDNPHKAAYFGLVDGSPGVDQILRVDLGSFTLSGIVNLDRPGQLRFGALLDSAGGYAYYSLFTSPGRIVRIKLSNFRIADTLVLQTGENGLNTGVIDPAGGYAYFVTDSPARVVKVRLSDFKRVGALALEPAGAVYGGAALDAGRGYAYFAANITNAPTTVVQVRLSDFTQTANLQLSSQYAGSTSRVNPATGLLYLVKCDAWATSAAILRVADIPYAASSR